MEGRKEKKVIIVAGEKRETPRRHHRVNMADMVTAVRGGERRGEERRGEERRREERSFRAVSHPQPLGWCHCCSYIQLHSKFSYLIDARTRFWIVDYVYTSFQNAF